MEFKQVPSCPKYEVSRCGVVRHIKKGTVVTGSTLPTGYRRVIMRSHPKKGEYVHRMVAEVYCEGYDPKLTVNHIDLDKTNNHADNLEWVTMGENSRSGKITKHSAKYEKIKLMHQSGMTQVAIGEALGLRQGYISKVVNGVFYGC